MTSEILSLQAPKGMPRSTIFSTDTDPLVPPSRTSEMLAHFPDSVYDKSPESHLSRLLRVLLGESGTGQLRKRYAYAHLSQFLATTRYHDLDRFFSGIFGVKRFIRERLILDGHRDAGTDSEWEAINAADAAYRSRLEAFSAALSMAGTPTGMATAASALLGDEVRVYETYEFLEMGVDLPFESRLPAAGGRTEFVVRPLRSITAEEEFQLTRVLSRIKPADALLTIDTSFAVTYVPKEPARVAASSTYWHVRKEVAIEPEKAGFYARYVEGDSAEQPRLAFSQYQGEAWNYNGEVAEVLSYAEDADGQRVQDVNYDRFVDPRGRAHDYTPALSLTDPTQILLGRMVSDGVLASPISDRSGS